MKNTIYSLITIGLIAGCVNNSEEPTIDCSEANLSVEIESSIESECQNPGSVTVVAQGGVQPYFYSSNGIDFQESSTLENVFAGSLELFVKDANGCTDSKEFVLEAKDNSVSLSLISTTSECVSNTGTITATASGGSGGYTYLLDDANSNETGSFSNVSAGSHQVTVSDSDGCEISNSITIESESSVSLSSDIMPIVNTNCAISGCHNGSISPNLSTSSAVMSNASKIRSETQSGSMPRGRTLSDTQINQIACWVDAGAENN